VYNAFHPSHGFGGFNFLHEVQLIGRIANMSPLRPAEPSTSIAPASGADGNPDQASEQDGGQPMEREHPGIIQMYPYSQLT
jgi:hypothetical protein